MPLGQHVLVRVVHVHDRVGDCDCAHDHDYDVHAADCDGVDVYDVNDAQI